MSTILPPLGGKAPRGGSEKERDTYTYDPVTSGICALVGSQDYSGAKVRRFVANHRFLEKDRARFLSEKTDIRTPENWEKRIGQRILMKRATLTVNGVPTGYRDEYQNLLKKHPDKVEEWKSKSLAMMSEMTKSGLYPKKTRGPGFAADNATEGKIYTAARIKTDENLEFWMPGDRDTFASSAKKGRKKPLSIPGEKPISD